MSVGKPLALPGKRATGFLTYVKIKEAKEAQFLRHRGQLAGMPNAAGVGAVWGGMISRLGVVEKRKGLWGLAVLPGVTGSGENSAGKKESASGFVQAPQCSSRYRYEPVRETGPFCRRAMLEKTISKG